MNYIELTCKISPYNATTSEILVAQLGEIGFESFVEQPDSLQAYIIENGFDENKIAKLKADSVFDSQVEFSFKKIEEENWNETWEKNYFEPIVIDEQCVIRSSFHPEFPAIKYRITIDPKMSFGTGHHETTSLMIKEILKLDLEDKTILDMGSGTGILAILSALKGATNITAVDFDEWCYKNCFENMALNGTQDIKVIHGDINAVKGLKFDIIYANINKNVLLSDIKEYTNNLNPSGYLLLSGFYKADFEDINKVAKQNGLVLQKEEELNQWMMLKYLK